MSGRQNEARPAPLIPVTGGGRSLRTRRGLFIGAPRALPHRRDVVLPLLGEKR